MLNINLLAVIEAAVAAFVLGFLFHGPVLGKLWMKLANIKMTGKEKFSDMVPQLIWNLFVNFVTAYVFAAIYILASASPMVGGPSIAGAIIVAIMLWAGFLLTSTAIPVIWMKASLKLWFFESACSLVVMIVMAAIIASQ